MSSFYTLTAWLAIYHFSHTYSICFSDRIHSDNLTLGDFIIAVFFPPKIGKLYNLKFTTLTCSFFPQFFHCVKIHVTKFTILTVFNV